MESDKYWRDQMRLEIEQLRSQLTVAKAALNVAAEALDVERSKPREPLDAYERARKKSAKKSLRKNRAQVGRKTMHKSVTVESRLQPSS